MTSESDHGCQSRKFLRPLEIFKTDHGNFGIFEANVGIFLVKTLGEKSLAVVLQAKISAALRKFKRFCKRKTCF